ncbi:LysR family transcriptional regulator, partial [Enterobacter sp. CER55]
WGFLPTHFHAGQWQNVKRLHTEVGSQGIGQTMVTIWKPGSDKRSTIAETLSLLPDVWKQSAL